jgi:hypothetical protein
VREWILSVIKSVVQNILGLLYISVLFSCDRIYKILYKLHIRVSTYGLTILEEATVYNVYVSNKQTIYASLTCSYEMC